MERPDRLRLALVCDFAEEQWPSMELVADMLMENLNAGWGSRIEVTRVRPKMKWRFSRLPGCRKAWWSYSADRLLNRCVDYPRHLMRAKSEFDLYHITDHSYSHLIRKLPAKRTIVSCYDLDTFRCLLDPEHEPRSRFFMLMTARILDGLRQAERVSCASAATRDELAARCLVPRERMAVVPLGVHAACGAWPDPSSDAEVARLLGPCDPAAAEILHVGTTVGRKRIDVLLHVMAAVRNRFPRLPLIRVGGPLTSAQRALAAHFDLTRSIVTMPFLNRWRLASVYRRAALLILPSEREGFGLPVIEAMACGTPAVVSDLPALREVGGPPATYCRVADISLWAETIVELLYERETARDRWKERRLKGIAWSRRFSWREHARKTVQLYEELAHAPLLSSNPERGRPFAYHIQ